MRGRKIQKIMKYKLRSTKAFFLRNTVFFSLCLIFLSLLFSSCLKTHYQLNQEQQQKALKNQIAGVQQFVLQEKNSILLIQEKQREMDGKLGALDMNLKQLSETMERQSEEIENLKVALLAFNKKMQAKPALQAKPAPQAKPVPNSQTKSKRKLGNFGQAEVDFSNNRCKEAVAGYQRYRELNPKGNVYGKATYRMAICLERIDGLSSAKPFYQEVIQKYPNGGYAKEARKKLR